MNCTMGGLLFCASIFLVLQFSNGSSLDSSAPWPTNGGDQERTGQSSINFSYNNPTPITLKWQKELQQVCHKTQNYY